MYSAVELSSVPQTKLTYSAYAPASPDQTSFDKLFAKTDARMNEIRALGANGYGSEELRVEYSKLVDSLQHLREQVYAQLTGGQESESKDLLTKIDASLWGNEDGIADGLHDLGGNFYLSPKNLSKIITISSDVKTAYEGAIQGKSAFFIADLHEIIATAQQHNVAAKKQVEAVLLYNALVGSSQDGSHYAIAAYLKRGLSQNPSKVFVTEELERSVDLGVHNTARSDSTMEAIARGRRVIADEMKLWKTEVPDPGSHLVLRTATQEAQLAAVHASAAFVALNENQQALCIKCMNDDATFAQVVVDTLNSGPQLPVASAAEALDQMRQVAEYRNAYDDSDQTERSNLLRNTFNLVSSAEWGTWSSGRRDYAMTRLVADQGFWHMGADDDRPRYGLKTDGFQKAIEDTNKNTNLDGTNKK